MQKPILAIKTDKRNYIGLISLGNAVYEALSGNIHFILPTPSLSVLRTKIDETTLALSKWGNVRNRGSKADLLDLRNKAGKLKLDLTALLNYLQNTVSQLAPGEYARQEAILGTTGFPFRNKNRPQGVLEQVQNLRSLFSRAFNINEISLAWVKPLNLNSRNNVAAFLVYKSSIPVFSTAKEIAKTTKTSYKDFNDTGVEQTWYYWVVPVNYAGPGAISEILKVKVLPL